MRKFATAVAFLALTSFSTAHSAEKDFATLLAELSFGSADQLINTPPRPPVDHSRTLASTASARQPLSDPPATQGVDRYGPSVRQTPSVYQGTAAGQAAVAPQGAGVQQPPAAHPGQSIQQGAPAGVAEAKPPVSLTNPAQAPLTYPTPAAPINPASTAMGDPSSRVDFNAAFTVQEGGGAIQAQMAGHAGLAYGKRYADCGFEQQYPPRAVPNLPNSTLYQYFRSNRCHTNVWVGYHQKCCPSLRNIDQPFRRFFQGFHGHSCLLKGGCMGGCEVVDHHPHCGCEPQQPTCGCGQQPCGCEPQRPMCGCEPQQYVPQQYVPQCGCEPQRPVCGCEPHHVGAANRAGYYR